MARRVAYGAKLKRRLAAAPARPDGRLPASPRSNYRALRLSDPLGRILWSRNRDRAHAARDAPVPVRDSRPKHRANPRVQDHRHPQRRRGTASVKPWDRQCKAQRGRPRATAPPDIQRSPKAPRSPHPLPSAATKALPPRRNDCRRRRRSRRRGSRRPTAICIATQTAGRGKLSGMKCDRYGRYRARRKAEAKLRTQ